MYHHLRYDLPCLARPVPSLINRHILLVLVDSIWPTMHRFFLHERFLVSQLPISSHEVQVLRDRGLVITNEDGIEGIHITLQCLQQPPANTTRSQWRDALGCWCQDVASKLCEHGVVLSLETLSSSAQTVEAFVPVDLLQDAKRCQELEELRVDIIDTHRVTMRPDP